MKELERSVKGFFFRNMFVSMFFLVVGIILCFWPTISATFISYVFGTILLANGVSYLLDNPEKIFHYDTVLLGIISIPPNLTASLAVTLPVTLTVLSTLVLFIISSNS